MPTPSSAMAEPRLSFTPLPAAPAAALRLASPAASSPSRNNSGRSFPGPISYLAPALPLAPRNRRVDTNQQEEYLHPYAHGAGSFPTLHARTLIPLGGFMSNPVRAIPEGYHSISPALTCKDAASAIDFYKSVFGATEIMRMPGPGGVIMHAELRIGDSVIFVNDEIPGMASAPTGNSVNPVYLFLYTENVDAVYNRAVAAGCKVTMPLADMFWGDSYGKLNDPYGHSWGIATHVEDVAPEYMKRRQAEWTSSMAKAAGQS